MSKIPSKRQLALSLGKSLINAAAFLDDEDFISFMIGTFKCFPIDDYLKITRDMFKNPDMGKNDEPQQ